MNESACLLERIAEISGELSALRERARGPAGLPGDRAREARLTEEICVCISRAAEMDLTRRARDASSLTGLAILDAVLRWPGYASPPRDVGTEQAGAPISAGPMKYPGGPRRRGSILEEAFRRDRCSGQGGTRASGRGPAAPGS